MGAQERAIPAPAETLGFAVRAAAQQQEAEAIGIVAEHSLEGHTNRTDLWLQQAKLPIGIHTLEDGDAAVMLQHGGSRRAPKLSEGNLRQRHR